MAAAGSFSAGSNTGPYIPSPDYMECLNEGFNMLAREGEASIPPQTMASPPVRLTSPPLSDIDPKERLDTPQKQQRYNAELWQIDRSVEPLPFSSEELAPPPLQPLIPADPLSLSLEKAGFSALQQDFLRQLGALSNEGMMMLPPLPGTMAWQMVRTLEMTVRWEEWAALLVQQQFEAVPNNQPVLPPPQPPMMAPPPVVQPGNQATAQQPAFSGHMTAGNGLRRGVQHPRRPQKKKAIPSPTPEAVDTPMGGSGDAAPPPPPKRIRAAQHAAGRGAIPGEKQAMKHHNLRCRKATGCVASCDLQANHPEFYAMKVRKNLLWIHEVELSDAQRAKLNEQHERKMSKAKK
ncbi:uncharacterized protein LTR77_001620 [Saxophila tyrrhenica]|uniref:Uncharacterized protein n=1 Tax=Saxophila tyrrhenica TaxID=1690608 RepID=A0AAV9PLC0_9PEZI|nr:hypothetical protein LTR77_001620 [Saxophila tyrrhenica]